MSRFKRAMLIFLGVVVSMVIIPFLLPVISDISNHKSLFRGVNVRFTGDVTLKGTPVGSIFYSEDGKIVKFKQRPVFVTDNEVVVYESDTSDKALQMIKMSGKILSHKLYANETSNQNQSLLFLICKTDTTNKLVCIKLQSLYEILLSKETKDNFIQTKYKPNILLTRNAIKLLL